MSVARRELKAIAELEAWIDARAETYGAPAEGGTPRYRIVRRSPRTGSADWRVVSDAPGSEVRPRRPRWHASLRHAIRRAQLLFDLR